ncbi:MAG: 3-hydroxyacyl-CoA dehydrogenase/enoyl-CoA hydratase family protein [Lentisphaeria bacterium]|nr:3-hydroxyacyl-CoA dehydrogenase/enoyl-CoA hydratase family protein [Lentisphaeria bacterium]
MNIRQVAVLGSGVMGSQIAAHFANTGHQVLLLDLKKDGKNVADKALSLLKKLSPPPLYSESVLPLIRTGNFDDDLGQLSEVDWIIEAIIENPDIKRSLFEKVDKVRKDSSIVTTNTSGIPIQLLVEGRSDSFRKHFFGSHFFNPPRYLKLLEIIPGDDTDEALVAEISEYARLVLGKGVVVCKDRPNFIGNRIGIYSLMLALNEFIEGNFTIEEIDTLTGPLIGRPKSATMRTVDLVGVDLLGHVAGFLYSALKDDPCRETFKLPKLVTQMVEAGLLGAKVKKGFYHKADGEILSLDPETMTYTPAEEMKLEGLKAYQKIRNLDDRMKALLNDDGRIGEFYKRVLLPALAYSAQRIPEISDYPEDIDKAMRWGFAWEQGPFQVWEAIGWKDGVELLEREGIEIPDWCKEISGIYRDGASFVPGENSLKVHPKSTDELVLADYHKNKVRDYGDALLYELEDGVLVFQAQTKANIITSTFIDALFDAIELVEEGDYAGLLVANDDDLYSAGANLAEMLEAAKTDNFDMIEGMIKRFQQLCRRIHYASKPVVVVWQGRVFGGGCELGMASNYLVAAADTFAGLVEFGVGLVPAGGGIMRLAKRASDYAADKNAASIRPALKNHFETVGMAKVSTSGMLAKEMNLIGPNYEIVNNKDRRISVAVELIKFLNAKGYKAPVEELFMVLGESTAGALNAFVYNMCKGQFISEYDMYMCKKLSHIICGGNLKSPTYVSEDYILDLEREAFLSLLGEEKTHQRIESILTTNKPLRN